MLSAEDLKIVTDWCRERMPADKPYAIMQNGTVFMTDGESTDVTIDDSWLDECRKFGDIPAIADISTKNREYLADFFPRAKLIRRTVIAQTLTMMKRYGYPTPGSYKSDRAISPDGTCWLAEWPDMDGVITVFPRSVAPNEPAAVAAAGELTRWDFTAPRFHYIRGKK